MHPSARAPERRMPPALTVSAAFPAEGFAGGISPGEAHLASERRTALGDPLFYFGDIAKGIWADRDDVQEGDAGGLEGGDAVFYVAFRAD